MEFKNKKVLIMGIGIAMGGVEDALFFARQGADVVATDLKNENELGESAQVLKGAGVALHLGGHRESDFETMDLIIKNPAIPDNSRFLAIAERNNIPIEMGSGIFFKEGRMEKLVGVTGTKGKSTTTALIQRVLQTKIPDIYKAGDVNESPLKFLGDNKAGKWGVMELSSWRLEGVKRYKKSPHIAVITSIAQDHLNRYASYEDYKRAKKIIVDFQQEHDFAILNYDSEYLRGIAPELRSNILWFSGSEKPEAHVSGVGCYIQNGVLYSGGKQYEYNDKEFNATHHSANIACVVTVASLFEVSVNEALRAIQSFEGLFGRLQCVAEKNGIKWYNDTAATNPYATQQSIQTLGTDGLAVIVGGEDKEMDFSELTKTLGEVPYVFIIPGSASDKIHRENEKYHYDFARVDTLEEAVRGVQKSGARNILFSPGAASFNMFKNEFDRGNKFIAYVRSL